MPLVVGADGFRLSKQEGAVTLADRIAVGESPAEVLGFMAHSLGLLEAPQPIAAANELIQMFDANKLPTSQTQLSANYLTPS